jgi:addiction module HigA family antidote
MAYIESQVRPTHPGEVFKEDVLAPLGITVTKAAELLGVSRKSLSEFINQKVALSPDLAMRIAKATNTSVESWLGMQHALVLWDIKHKEIDNVHPMSLVG